MRWMMVGLVLVTVSSFAHAREEERSPFDAVRWQQAEPQVKVDGVWYELVSLDKLSSAEVIAACRALDAEKWKKRFNEDLVAALTKVGHAPGQTATLVVRIPGEDETRTLTNVPVTNDKRDRVRNSRSFEVAKRIQRKHSDTVDPRYAFLAKRLGLPAERDLTAQEAQDDLDQLEWHIEHTYSYRDLTGVDYRAALDSIRCQLGESIGDADFHVQLRKLIALFGDGHAHARSVAKHFPRGRLIMELVDTADGAMPQISEIDGKPIQDWIDAAKRYNARGTPGFEQRQALEWLTYVDAMRLELGLPLREIVSISIRRPDGKDKGGTIKLPVKTRRAQTGPDLSNRLTRTDIASISIRKMEREPADMLEAIRMRSSGAKGLIIDVRGNGGGTRHILAALLPHLLAPDAKPVVCNVGAYRMPPGTTPTGSFLADRFLWPAGHPHWSDAEREVATAHMQSFKPDWAHDPTRRLFAPFEIMVVSPAPEGAWRFTGPIALLIDSGCFSATDIFVGALETLPQVTLIGSTTGGGSGRSREFRLTHSRIRVRLSTMASFRPNGQRYDGKGIAPDIEVIPKVSDWTPRAGSVTQDPVIAKAYEHLGALLDKSK